VQGKADVVELVLLCLVAEGHLLIEDVPGVGKTSLAKALAASLSEDSEVRVAMEEAVSSLQGPAEEHLQWAAQAQQTMVLTQSQSKLAQTAGAVVEQVAGKVKDLLGR